MPTLPVEFGDAAPRIFTLARAAWLSEVPVKIDFIPRKVSVIVPVLWKVDRFVITVQVAVTTPPGDEVHVSIPVFGSKVQNWLKKPATVLVSTLSESVGPCT